MLRKLAVGGLKNRWKDYLILLSGLIISSAIFYLFETLATNSRFLQANGEVVSFTGYIFNFGSILLMLITFVYLNYANNFLLNMRKHDYGLFMMLGAKKKKIGQLVWVETILIGILSTIIGIALGILASSFVPRLLTKLLGITPKYYEPFWGKAILWTALLYLGLFLLGAILNTIVMVRKPALKLLKSEQTVSKSFMPWYLQLLQALVGILLLVAGYWVISNANVLKQSTIPASLITLTLGSYFLFNASIIVIIDFLRKSRLAKKGLNTFTLGQLKYRIFDYTRILTVVSMLFALALGAITTGIGFRNSIENAAHAQSAYTMGILEPSNQQKRLIAKLKVEKQGKYKLKATENVVYLNKKQVKDVPLQMVKFNNSLYNIKYVNQSIPALEKNSNEIMSLLPTSYSKHRLKVVGQNAFVGINTKNKALFLFRVKNITNDYALLQKLENTKNKDGVTVAEQLAANTSVNGSFSSFKQLKTIFGGFEFIGIFLGVAFLAMLASCLMFKILSGAFADVRRYQLLAKLGVRKRDLKWAIKKEIGILFVLPGALGVVHVMFGLKLFKALLNDPYYAIWIPFTIFGLLYFGYYTGMVLMYERIVLNKKRQSD